MVLSIIKQKHWAIRLCLKDDLKRLRGVDLCCYLYGACFLVHTGLCVHQSTHLWRGVSHTGCVGKLSLFRMAHC